MIVHAIPVSVLFFRYLGYVDKIGIAYQCPSIASGYGAYMAQVIHAYSYCISLFIIII